MSDRNLTPEDVIRQMSTGELRELLRDLSMDASVSSALRLRTLVDQLNDFEAAIEGIAGVATLPKAA